MVKGVDHSRETTLWLFVQFGLRRERSLATCHIEGAFFQSKIHECFKTLAKAFVPR